jgi:phage gpG-like protein
MKIESAPVRVHYLFGGDLMAEEAFTYNFKLTDNSEEILRLTDEAIEYLLEVIGLEAEGDVIVKISTPGWIPKEPIDTGNLKNSINHQVVVKEKAVYIGTNVEYAPYVEFGTGDLGSGTGKKWTYRDDEGKFHQTSGMAARPFMAKGISENIKKYRDVTERYLKMTFE